MFILLDEIDRNLFTSNTADPFVSGSTPLKLLLLLRTICCLLLKAGFYLFVIVVNMSVWLMY